MNIPWHLIDGYLDRALTEAELRELQEWLDRSPENLRCMALAAQDHACLRSHYFRPQCEVRDASPHPKGLTWLSWICRWRPVAIGVAAVLAVAGILWMPMQAHTLPPAVSEVVGALWVERDGTSRLVERGERLQPGDVVRTQVNSRATLRSSDEATFLELQENSAVEIPRNAGAPRFELLSGGASLTVSTHWPGRSVEVRTRHTGIQASRATLKLFTSPRATRVRVDRGEALLNGTTAMMPTETETLAGEVGSEASVPDSPTGTLQSPPQGGLGAILRETWLDVPGMVVADLKASPAFPDSPSVRDYPTSLESVEGGAQHDFYGARWRGFLHPPVSGSYTFWIAADDSAELMLSDDERPEQARRIAFVPNYTMPRQWTKTADQESVAIPLKAGHRYYLEVLHKENAGGDHVAVAWQLPGAAPVVISGRYLSPWIR